MLTSAKRVDFKGKNLFAVEQSALGPMLRSTPQNSASGLYMKVNADSATLRKVRWAWTVDRIQPGADLRDLKTEDSAATVFFVFGEPSWWSKDVPTIAYAWTATPVQNGAVIRSMRLSKMRYVQLRGAADVGRWRTERRDVAADYRLLFGEAPPPLRYIAIFNDNDQTSAAVSAMFGPVFAE
ncbi:MAG: DUF3047 domain-containing protein [Hyphomicrobiales bacterium]|nr:DUF3047 domain-containing protein [Hyphomicrobiales bacterium]